MLRRRWGRPALLAALFIVSRLAYAAGGLRFYSDSLYYFMQFLEPDLLRDRLLTSLWYLHCQPPLLNLIAGIALKIGGERGYPLLMHGVFFAAGFASLLFLDGSLRLLGARKKTALAMAFVFCASPPFLFFENWCFYPHLCLTLVSGAGYGLLRARGGGGRWLGFAFWNLAGLVWLRSLYHPYYLLACAAGAILFVRRGERRRAAYSIAGPAAVVLLLGLKNLLVFGFFGTSSWLGLGLHRVAAMDIDKPTMMRLEQAGIVSKLSLTPSFSPIPPDDPLFAGKRGDWTDPALTRVHKTVTNEASAINPWNFNHWTYLETSPLYLRDAIRLIRFDPHHFAAAVAWNFQRFLDAVDDDPFIREKVVGQNPAMRRLLDASVAVEGNLAWKWTLGFILLGSVVRACWPRIRRNERIFLLFASGTCLWVAAIGNLFETGENNRFRYDLMGLALAMGVRLAIAGLRRMRGLGGKQALLSRARP